MKGWICLLTLAACGAGDDTADGARAKCAEGGALNACPDAPKTPEDACWRLVDCGAIPVHRDDPNEFDWGNCVNRLEGFTTIGRELTIGCIAASTGDQPNGENL